ncbi:MAG: RES family NAD+ phosphorylase [Propionibacteriaceae bacterium]|jgi:hypothetical protein|nr:RES family NAD+ phosphorylase [Propionibacteriaceae bacterium]
MGRSPQDPPDPAADYASFPAATLAAGSEVVRAHGPRPPWWFSASGRFGLRPPRGTLYAADDVATALRERHGVITLAAVVHPAIAAQTRVSYLRLGRDWRCADIGHPDAAGFGVTRELAAAAPVLDPGTGAETYQAAPAWAEAFDRSGAAGIRYGARFSPGPDNAWALFGAAGDSERPAPAVRTITGETAFRLIGVTVSSRHSSATLTFATP